MKIKINFKRTDLLLRAIGAKEAQKKIDVEIDEFVSKLRSKEGMEVSTLDDVELDEDGYLTAHGERIVLYIKDSHNNADDVKNDPKGDRVVRYHIHGQCSTLKAMKNDGRFNRYVLKSKPDGLFVVDCEENQIKNKYGNWVRGSGKTITVPDVELGICKCCLNAAGIGHQKTAREWRDTFDIQDFFKRLKPLVKPTKPKYTDQTFPDKDKRYDREYKRRSKKLKQEAEYKCSKCGVDLNGSIRQRRLLHTHHLDGNDRIHRYNNLRVLCVICHQDEGKSKFSNELIKECNQVRREQNII